MWALINNLSILLLSVWTIYSGLRPFFIFDIPYLSTITNLFVILTGLALLVRLRESKPIYAVGMLLLSAWFILMGVIPILNADLPGVNTLLSVMAGIAGISLMVMIRESRSATNVGLLLLGLYLVCVYLLPLFGIHFAYGTVVFAGVAVLSGLFMLLGF